jgi:hypothetical protein
MFNHFNRQFESATEGKLDALLHGQLAITTQLSALEKRMAAIDDQITALTAEVTRNTTVEKSALALIQGFSAQLTAAVNAALAAGATPAELAALTALDTTLKANDDELAAAISQNTPAAS